MERGNSIFRHVCAGVMIATTTICYSAEEKLIILDEGLWQADNGRLSYFADGDMVSNQWFRDVNGYKLGDTPNYIIAVNDGLIAIAVNWSNVVQFITPEGKAVGAVESIPNVRCLASDGNYVYATSYAHECYTSFGLVEFEKGYVAKIDIKDFSVVGVCEVGYEPEGIALYNGTLFIANSGGYAFQEGHDYEQTVTLVETESMEKTGEIDTGCINLYGDLSQSGRYLCINSTGDYYETPGRCIIMDCKEALKNPESCFVVLPYAATYNCASGAGQFFAVGAGYSYLTGEYEFNCLTLNAQEILESYGERGVTEGLPGDVAERIMQFEAPYSIYRNPYTGKIYATDAGSYAGSGRMYQWSADGQFTGSWPTYINPGKMLALRPDSDQSRIETIEEASDIGLPKQIYDLLGRKVSIPIEGEMYIVDGKKVIY